MEKRDLWDADAVAEKATRPSSYHGLYLVPICVIKTQQK